jgi:hypothetical protein
MVMSNIYGGHIALSCARGEKGVGVAVIAKGNGGMGRQVSSRWPGLDRNDEGAAWLFEASAEKEMKEVWGIVPAVNGHGEGNGERVIAAVGTGAAR